MAEFLREWLVQTWTVTVETAPWLLGGFFLAGILHAWVPVGRIATHLGRSSFGGVIKAAILGAPLPLCSCSVVPLASAMRRSGASRGATAAFLISTPETGVDSISVTYALLGPVLAVVRPLAALVSAVTAGLLINRFAPEHGSAESEPAGSCSGACGCDCVGQPGAEIVPDESAPAPGVLHRLREALRYGFLDMFADLAVWLVIGFVLAGLISAALPAHALARYVGPGWLAMLAVLAIGLPLYVCATSSTPIAAVLIAKGLSPGTALVFLLAGPATNVTTMMVVAKELGRRGLLIYLISIAAVAVGLGILVDLALIVPALDALRMGVEIEENHSLWATLMGGIFAILLFNGLWLRYRPRARTQLAR